MVILLGLYTAQSVVTGIVQASIPIVMRESGLALDQIGLVSLLSLPWALKILWAPLIDRFGHTTLWILACQICMALCMFALAMLQITVNPLMAVPLFAVIALAASTQDIATDATSIHATTGRTRSLASGASAAGGYMGFLLGGGVWLWVYANFGWHISIFIAGLGLILLTLPVLFARGDLNDRYSDRSASIWQSFKSAQLRRGLLVVLGWQSAVRLTLMLTGTLLVDAGLDLEQIAWIRGGASMGVGLVTALMATWLANRIGLRPLLHLAAALFVLCCLAQIAWIWGWIGGLHVLVALHLSFSAAISVSFVAIYAALMGFCDERRAATDFSILQAFDVLLLVAAGVLSGVLAEKFGYAPVFGLAAAVMLLSWPLTIRLIRPEPEHSLTHDPEYRS